jgi:hypothetical protein
MPALKKLGEELGLSMENGVSGVVNGALEPSVDQVDDVDVIEEEPQTEH